MKSWNWQKVQEVLSMIAFVAAVTCVLLFFSLTENHMTGRVNAVKKVEKIVVINVESGMSFMIDEQWLNEPIIEGELYAFSYANGFLYPRRALRVERCSSTEKK